MNAPKFSYDKLGDTLYIAFSPGEKAIGIELTDDILLRIHPTEHRAIGMTFFGVSYLAEPTAHGYRSFTCTGLDRLSEQRKAAVLHILQTAPVNRFIQLCAHTERRQKTEKTTPMVLPVPEHFKEALRAA